MKIGILGAGSIAIAMAKTLETLPENEAYAIASRDYEKALAFAEKYKVTKAYGSYEDMLKDPEVGLVYIATPHSHHYEHMKLCIEYGKNILCEKSFTVNAAQAREILELGKAKKLLVSEAIWTRYMPFRWKINEVLESGIIGEPYTLTCNLGYVTSQYQRIREPELAGGALLDVGVYVINFASMFFGDDIESVTSGCVKLDTGVDASNHIAIKYKDGKLAVIYSTILASTDRRGVINGSKGYIVIDNINNYEKIHVYNTNHELIAEYNRPEQITGYEYQVLSAVKAIKEGKLECPEMPHSEIIKIMEFMDNLRAEWGLKYSFKYE
jgi:predicted dehydrogenase